MDDKITPELLRALVAKADSGHQAAVVRLAARCWPGGAADRIEPAALDWLRRWRPARARYALPACSCAEGRCPVCN